MNDSRRPLTARILQVGDSVTVSHPARGSVRAQVEQIATPEQLPHIEDAPPADFIRELLEELGIVQIAFISHPHNDQTIMFAALGDGGGRWWDLQRQNLEIRLME